ncbi:ABC transporter ATP-binding protein [Algibacter sp.]|nr:ABC transporter ATP-binding protein [Algibacter sp.]MDB4273999.1 ABC transporter ATP-binding protein [Algibacter sp.]
MILNTEHIAKSFGKNKVLKDISFQLKAGSITGIVGENGSGKSVLMEIIVGARSADKGIINRNGKIGYCPQRALLFPHLTVQEHFIYFSTAYGIGIDQLKRRSEELLLRFNYKKYKQEKIINLSGGTQQKLNLSIALLHEPDLLILDEPYNGFDWDTYQRFWNYTNHLKKQGCAILIVTHLLSEKERLDHIYELENGVLV